jgi:hypothetical protein
MQQDTNRSPQPTPTVNFLLEAITGGEKWSDMSGRRKAVLLLLLLSTVLSTVLACLQAMPNTLDEAIMRLLFLWGLVWLWTLILYPRIKRRPQGEK